MMPKILGLPTITREHSANCTITSKTGHEHVTVVDDECGHNLIGQEAGMNEQKEGPGRVNNHQELHSESPIFCTVWHCEQECRRLSRKLQLRHLHEISTSGPSPAPVVANDGRVSDLSKNCRCGVSRVLHSFALCVPTTAYNWNVWHFYHELNVRHLQKHEQEGLLELRLHDDRDVMAPSWKRHHVEQKSRDRLVLPFLLFFLFLSAPEEDD